MKNIDYNKIMCVIGILLITTFCVILVLGYNLYNKLLIRSVGFCLVGEILIYLYNANTNLKTKKYTIKNEKLPVNFNGYKILHISDFHNTNSKRIKTKILQSISKNKPDIIVITGDLIDSRRTNIYTVKELLITIVDFVPVYYVFGNHESRLRDIQMLINEVKSIGVNVLRNETIDIFKDNECIKITGLEDPAFYIPLETSHELTNYINKILQAILKKDNKFNVLITHRPEYITQYAQHNYEIVFAGHAHGGQIRLPIFGGVIAPRSRIFS